MADLTRKTANLVDQNVFATTYTNYVTSANGIITFNSVTSTMSSEGVTVDIPANTVFTCIPLEVTNGILSFRIRFEGETEQDRQMVYLYDSNGEPNTIAPVTLSFAVKKITIFWSNASGGKTAAFKNFMVNAGSEPLPYEPYGWVHSLRKLTTAIDVVTNLPVTLYTDGQPVSSYTLKGNTSVSGTPSPQNPVTIQGVGNETANLLEYKRAGYNLGTNGYLVQTNDYDMWFAPVTAGQTYVAQNVSGTYGFYTSKQSERDPVTYDGSRVTFSGTQPVITVPQGVSYIGIRTVAGTTNAMLNAGSTVLPYEPLGYKIPISSGQTALTPVYLTEQLMKIGDYADSLASTGTATYNTKKMVLTGQETFWGADGTIGTLSRYTILPTGADAVMRGSREDIYCTHYTADANHATNTIYVYSGTTGVYIYFYVPAADYPTLADYKAYIQQQYAAGTPVTVYYILATAETEQVTAPSIPTTDGANTITVDTTVQPSEFTATWTGWHNAYVKEYDGADWQ